MRSIPLCALALLVLLSACGDPGPDATEAGGRLDATIDKSCYADRDCPDPQMCNNRPLCGANPVCLGPSPLPGLVPCGLGCCVTPCTSSTCGVDQVCSAGGCCEPASCRVSADCGMPDDRCLLGRCIRMGVCQPPPQ